MDSAREAALFFLMFLDDLFMLSEEERRLRAFSWFRRIQNEPTPEELEEFYGRYVQFLETLKRNINVEISDSGAWVLRRAPSDFFSPDSRLRESNEQLLTRYLRIASELRSLEGELANRNLPMEYFQRLRRDVYSAVTSQDLQTILDNPVRFGADPIIGAVDFSTLMDIFTRRTGA